MKQIKNNTQSYLALNGSQFYCYGYPIDDEKKIKEIISQLWKENKKAVHICYGCVIKKENQIIEKSDDDGEPKNSAGKRIVAAIKDNNLINTLLVVVRFKSKSLLGLGLLTRSYYNVCDLLLKDEKNIQDYIKWIELEIKFKDQKHLNDIINISKKEKFEILDINDDQNTVNLLVNESKKQIFG